MEIPLDEKNLGTTKWVKGKCVTRMGKMYLNYFIPEWNLVRCNREDELLPRTFGVRNLWVTIWDDIGEHFLSRGWGGGSRQKNNPP